MKPGWVFVAVVSGSVAMACSGSSSGGSSGHGVGSSSSSSSSSGVVGAFADPSGGTLTDRTGDVFASSGGQSSDAPYVDIVSADVVVDATNITVRMTMASIPASMTFNAYVDTWSEYKWSVVFDVDGSGTISTGDIALALDGINSNGGSGTVITGALADHSNARALRYDSVTSSSISGSDITLDITKSIEGNTIVLTVAKAASSHLSSITSSTHVQFSGWHAADPQRTYYDTYP